jgi:hypothetical protein
MLRRAVRVGVAVNLAGLLLNLLAAEQITGVLAVRVLTRPSAAAGGLSYQSALLAASAEGLQPLDVLVVQANTNSLLSHFCSLASLLSLTDSIDRLDPPSTEDSQRRR